MNLSVLIDCVAGAEGRHITYILLLYRFCGSVRRDEFESVSITDLSGGAAEPKRSGESKAEENSIGSRLI